MAEFDWPAWRVILGLACLWMGIMIIAVGGLPRQLRRGETPTAAPGTPEAFGLWWLDQYAYIGLAAGVVGIDLLAYAAWTAG